MKPLTLLALLFTFTLGTSCKQQTGEQLFPGHMMAPAQLAKMIQDGSAAKLTILNIGPRKNIPGATKLGMISEPEGMAAFKAQLAKLPKGQQIVVYCGCCPYAHCPNVRPAAQELKDEGFTNYHILDLPNNIDKDWIQKGYPMQS